MAVEAVEALPVLHDRSLGLFGSPEVPVVPVRVVEEFESGVGDCDQSASTLEYPDEVVSSLVPVSPYPAFHYAKELDCQIVFSPLARVGVAKLQVCVDGAILQFDSDVASL